MGIATVSAIGLVAPAGAQQGYPPGACTTLTSSQALPATVVGRTVTYKLSPTCAFAAGTALTVTVNGVNIPGKVAAADGSVSILIQIVSATSALVDDPVSVPNICGDNRIVVSGRSTAANANVTHTGTYNVNCATPAAAATPATGGALSRTGSDTVKYAGVAVFAIVTGAGIVLFVRRRQLTAG